MSRRAWMLGAVLLSSSTAGCIARHPPWRLWSRPPCAEAEERVDRDRERIEKLQASGRRPDELVWYRDDLRGAIRALDRCKKEHPKKGADHEDH